MDEMSQTIITQFSSLLENCKFVQVLDLLTVKEKGLLNESDVSEIMRIAISHLTETNEQHHIELFQCCKDTLNKIAEIYYSIEFVLDLLEHIECLDNDVRFHAILEPLAVCIIKTEDKNKVIEWCISTIKSYVEDLPAPSIDDSDADRDAANHRIMNVYIEIISFLSRLTQEILDSNPEEEPLIGDYLLSFLISLYGKPFCSFSKNIVESVLYKKLLERMVTLAFYLARDVLCYLDIVRDRFRNVIPDRIQNGSPCSENCIRSILFEASNNISNLAYADFYFHIITREAYWQKMPQVYNPYYILETCTYLFKILFCEEQEILVSNGLTFMESVVRRIPPCSIGSEALGLHIYSDLFKPVIKVMIYCSDDTERKKAVYIFKDYIRMFNMEARYSILSHLYETSQHSSLLSLIINIIKFSIVECLNCTPRDSHFLGRNMQLMLKKICNLPRGSSSDLLEISDEVITALNLLRFLFIRDKRNETGVWDMRYTIENDYLKPLRDGIDLCRAHWRVKLKDLEQQKKDYANVRDYDQMRKFDAEVTLIVGGEQLPVMPISEKITFCYQAINGLDVMESILIRVNECIYDGEDNKDDKKNEYTSPE